MSNRQPGIPRKQPSASPLFSSFYGLLVRFDADHHLLNPRNSLWSTKPASSWRGNPQNTMQPESKRHSGCFPTSHCLHRISNTNRKSNDSPFHPRDVKMASEGTGLRDYHPILKLPRQRPFDLLMKSTSARCHQLKFVSYLQGYTDFTKVPAFFLRTRF